MSYAATALIPSFEPTEILPRIASVLKAAGFSVVVVDDGSGAGYSDIFTQTEQYATVLAYDVNRGKGYALKTGLKYISGHCGKDDIIVTVDSDGQHGTDDIRGVADAAAAQPGTLVLGVRNFGSNTPLRSLFGNTVTRLVYRLSTGCRVSDTQTGLRAFGAGMLPFMLSVSGDRYEYEMNVLMEAARQDVPMTERPIATIYTDGNKGSHFRTVRDSARIYANILKFAASSLVSFGVDYGMYSLLTLILSGLSSTVSVPLANVAARVVSASVNYTLNKRLVFKSRAGVIRTALQYFILAACILAGNTAMLSLLVNTFGMNRYAAKILTELTFFAVSWTVQRFIIFRESKKESADTAEAVPVRKAGRSA